MPLACAGAALLHPTSWQMLRCCWWTTTPARPTPPTPMRSPSASTAASNTAGRQTVGGAAPPSHPPPPRMGSPCGSPLRRGLHASACPYSASFAAFIRHCMPLLWLPAYVCVCVCDRVCVRVVAAAVVPAAPAGRPPAQPYCCRLQQPHPDHAQHAGGHLPRPLTAQDLLHR